MKEARECIFIHTSVEVVISRRKGVVIGFISVLPVGPSLATAHKILSQRGQHTPSFSCCGPAISLFKEEERWRPAIKLPRICSSSKPTVTLHWAERKCFIIMKLRYSKVSYVSSPWRRYSHTSISYEKIPSLVVIREDCMLSRICADLLWR